MPIVKVMKHRQVAIPKELFEKLKLEVGDYLEVKIEKGKLVYVPKELVDRQAAQAIEEAFEDIKAGRVAGPFKSAEELIESLRKPRGGRVPVAAAPLF